MFEFSGNCLGCFFPGSVVLKDFGSFDLKKRGRLLENSKNESYLVRSPKKTNECPLKIDGWKMIIFFETVPFYWGYDMLMLGVLGGEAQKLTWIRKIMFWKRTFLLELLGLL